ncbi:MAG TPA: ABC transporter substrate-binding protein [Acidimicrobiales bacterium]|nr:ABC transporter substrate-binding protein [Acidimicrobiales bacterium]
MGIGACLASAAVATTVAFVPGTVGAAGSKAPITVYFVNSQGSSTGSSSYPEVWRSAKVAANYVNSTLHGVHGQKLKLVVCPTLSTANTALQCANTSVSGGADVVQIGTTTYASVAQPVYEKAGVPVTIQLGTNTANYQSTDSFSFVASSLGQVTGVAEFAKAQHWKQVTLLLINVPSVTSSYADLAPAVFKKLGVGLNTVLVPPTATDMTSYIASAMASKPDAIFNVQGTASCAQSMQALQAIQAKVTFLAQPACNDPSVLPLVPSGVKFDVMTVNDATSKSDSDAVLYNKLMKKADPADLSNGFTPAGFQGIMNLYAALNAAKAPKNGFDKTSILAALRKAKNQPNFMTGGTTFTCNGTVVKGYPGACSTLLIVSGLQPNHKTFKVLGIYNKPTLLKGTTAASATATTTTTAATTPSS